jgi:outer membrane lipoprotein-sorting protein
MNRRSLLRLAPVVLAPFFALPAHAAPKALTLTERDRADIARVEAYLNTLQTLKAHFLQVAPDGSTAEGTAWMDRPGKMRFQYAPPSPLLLVAGHGLFFFHDSSLNQTTNLPLSATPLGLLLTDHLKLSGDVTVTAITRLPGQLQIDLVRTSSPDEGSLELVFADNPLALRQWSVFDARGQETRVTLFNVEFGGKFDPDLFVFVPGISSGTSGGN